MKWETRFCVFFPSSFHIVTWYFILALRFICLRVFFFFFFIRQVSFMMFIVIASC